MSPGGSRVALPGQRLTLTQQLAVGGGEGAVLGVGRDIGKEMGREGGGVGRDVVDDEAEVEGFKRGTGVDAVGKGEYRIVLGDDQGFERARAGRVQHARDTETGVAGTNTHLAQADGVGVGG